MGKLSRLFAVLALLLCAAPLAAAQTPGDVDYSEFYQALEPYGHWIEHPRYGLVWQPDAQQDATWKPYARGQWVFTDDYGWYWQSDEPFGWAVYHYGRWLLDRDDGWIWIPGNTWGPAWVNWRRSDDVVGWAPLPPDAVWSDDAGFATTSFALYDDTYFDPMWCFVPAAFIVAPHVWRHFEARNRTRYFLRRTRPFNGYAAVNHRVVNRGLDRAFVERKIHRKLAATALQTVQNRDGLRTGTGRGFLPDYRPQLRKDASHPAYRPKVETDKRPPRERNRSALSGKHTPSPAVGTGTAPPPTPHAKPGPKLKTAPKTQHTATPRTLPHVERRTVTPHNTARTYRAPSSPPVVHRPPPSPQVHRAPAPPPRPQIRIAPPPRPQGPPPSARRPPPQGKQQQQTPH